MADNYDESIQPTPRRRRRKRSKWQNFKEAYLPVLIALVAVVLMVVFISGSLKRANDGKKPDETQSSSSTVDASVALQEEAARLLKEAEALAIQYDYQGAMETLYSYSAGLTTNTELQAKYNEYNDAMSKLVAFNDVDSIPMITFRHLIQDLSRAMQDSTYGERYNSGYTTTSEFQKILQSLYDNGYVLVSLYDVAEISTNAEGVETMTQKTIYLPEGKKPILLAQTGVNYFTYIVDGNGDGLADADSDGFACKLVLVDGALTNEMYDAEGNVVTGAFDLIPILNAFVAEHPDFSYHGAMATIAVTGYDGLFGYRTDPETATKISEDYYQQQCSAVVPVIQQLREDGYDLACYTYDDASYGNIDTAQVTADLKLWTDEVTPLLGDVDILIYAGGSDISGLEDTYSGNKYQALKDFGFRYFIGRESSMKSWGQLTDEYLRLYSREVRGSFLNGHPEYYEDLFDAAKILDSSRDFS